jgi:ribosomal protein L11 methyltransferase
MEMGVGRGLSIKSEILRLLENERLRMTPSDLQRELCRRIPHATRAMIRSKVRELVSAGRLTFTQHFSTTHIEINFHRKVQVSNRIVLSPSEPSGMHGSDLLAIHLHAGIAFGAGDHPTTRLALESMDDILTPKKRDRTWPVRRALDVGTGTGILAIAAARLGVERVLGVDVDPLACHEAVSNVHLNNLAHRVRITSAALEDLSNQQFDLITMNLRPPTIRELSPHVMALSSPAAVWILSGFREEERDRVYQQLPKEMSLLLWQKVQNGWGAFAVKRVVDGK